MQIYFIIMYQLQYKQILLKEARSFMLGEINTTSVPSTG